MRGASVQTVENAIFHRLRFNFAKYFPNGFPDGVRIEDLNTAVEEVAEFHAGCEEIGSSDVTAMVRDVQRRLGIDPDAT